MAYLYQSKSTVEVGAHSLRHLKDSLYISEQGYSICKSSQFKVPVRQPIYFRARVQ